MIFLFLTLFLGLASAQETPSTVIFPIRTVNLDALEARGAELLLRRSYGSLTGLSVFAEDRTLQAMSGPEETELAEAATRLSAWASEIPWRARAR